MSKTLTSTALDGGAKEPFPLSSDLEFYPFLKRNLPDAYEIIAKPRTAYYSEWLFCYEVYRGSDLLETYEGDFRDLPAGTLINAAKSLLKKLEVSNAGW